MDIKVEDYLSTEELRQIAADAFTEAMRNKISEDLDRILSNAAYHAVWQKVDEIIGESSDEIIAKKAVGVINDLTTFSVFRAPDRFGPSNHCWDVVVASVRKNSDLVDAAVKKAIHNLSKSEALEILKSGVIQISPIKPN